MSSCAMPFQWSFRNRPLRRRQPQALRLLALGVLVGGLAAAEAPPAAAFQIPQTDIVAGPSVAAGGELRYLDLVINGISRATILEVRRDADGTWSAPADKLESAGLLPAEVARRSDGRIDLQRLPGVSFTYEAATQSLLVMAEPAARAHLTISATQKRQETVLPIDHTIGGVLNYALTFNPGYIAQAGEFDLGVAGGAFEARLYSPLGVLSHEFSVNSNDLTKIRRQSSNWRYTDPQGGWRATVGDLVTGSLDWTRPTRLGGVQVQNDFALQGDVVTFPVPGMSGSAALPSTAEVYVNGVQRFSTAIPDGPFNIVDLPLQTGAGTTTLVVRDANGQEMRIERPYYVARELLRPGLLDYSFEAGFARLGAGTDTDRYSALLMASSSLRLGLVDWLTLEAHAEGGSDLVNAGLGLTTSLFDRGVLQVAASASLTDEGIGYQGFGAVSFDLFGLPIRARLQTSGGNYHDIASFTYRDLVDGTSGAAPRMLVQLSTSLPTPIEALRLNLSYTELATLSGEHKRLVGVNFGQKLWGGSFSASGAHDLISGDTRVGLGYSKTFDANVSASTTVASDGSSLRSQTQVGVPMGDEAGDIGWRVTYGQDEQSRVSATAQTRQSVVEAEFGVALNDGNISGTGHLRGAITATEAGLGLATPIGDAFAVVDVGYPGVPVLVENNVVGTTGFDGKFIVTNLRGLEPNRVAIDPDDLPLDAVVLFSRQDIRPAEGAGVVVTFGGVKGGGSALVTFHDAQGAVLPLGTTGTADPKAEPFMVGYDGQAYVIGLKPKNRLELSLPDGSTCLAEFAFEPRAGEQVTLPNVVCRPKSGA